MMYLIKIPPTPWGVIALCKIPPPCSCPPLPVSLSPRPVLPNMAFLCRWALGLFSLTCPHPGLAQVLVMRDVALDLLGCAPAELCRGRFARVEGQCQPFGPPSLDGRNCPIAKTAKKSGFRYPTLFPKKTPKWLKSVLRVGNPTPIRLKTPFLGPFW